MTRIRWWWQTWTKTIFHTSASYSKRINSRKHELRSVEAITHARKALLGSILLLQEQQQQHQHNQLLLLVVVLHLFLVISQVRMHNIILRNSNRIEKRKAFRISQNHRFIAILNSNTITIFNNNNRKCHLRILRRIRSSMETIRLAIRIKMVIHLTILLQV